MSTSPTMDVSEFVEYATRVAWVAMRRAGINGRNGYEWFDDIRQDAHVALCEAAARYDPARGVPFTAYSIRRIQFAVTDGFRNRSWWSRRATEKGAPNPAYLGETTDYDSFNTALHVGFEEDLISRIDGEWRREWLIGHADLLTGKQRQVVEQILAGAPSGVELARRVGVGETAISHYMRAIAERLRPHALNECAECPSVFHRDTAAA